MPLKMVTSSLESKAAAPIWAQCLKDSYKRETQDSKDFICFLALTTFHNCDSRVEVETSMLARIHITLRHTAMEIDEAIQNKIVKAHLGVVDVLR